MSKVDIVHFTKGTYIFLSGAYITYSLVQYCQNLLKKRKSKEISIERKRKKKPSKIISDNSQNLQKIQQIEQKSLPVIKSQSVLEPEPAIKPIIKQDLQNIPECEEDFDFQKNVSEQRKGNLPSKLKNCSVVNLEEMATILPKEIIDEDKRKIIKVCLTGGPCAGKTSGLAFLSEKLRDDQFHVFVVPEAATIIANGGGMLDFGGYNEEDIVNFQKALMLMQIALEEQFYVLAQLTNSQSIVLCDRGLIDGKAFLSLGLWEILLRDLNFTEKQIRDERYDSVVHMVTAADGAPDFYCQDGVRFQNDEQAINIDKKFQAAWLGHSDFTIIDNKSVSSFQEKLEKLLFTIRKNCGVPVKGKKLYKRYILIDPESHPNLPSDLQVESFDIEDTFLYNAEYNEQQGKLTKIRKRTQVLEQEAIYMCSESHVMEGKHTMFFKKRLIYREYLLLKDMQDRSRQTIRKNRRQFVYKGYFYALDKYKDFDFCILRLKNSSGMNEQESLIPDYIQVDADVTKYHEFKSIALSLKNCALRDPEYLKDMVNDIYEIQKSEMKFHSRLRPRN